jgi:DNA-binding MarR family transcriptional regulator
MLHQNSIAERLIGKVLSGNPYWEILLDLYLADLEQRSLYQSCLAAGAPPANAHRHSIRLEAMGAVARADDPGDHRRRNVSLTPHMKEALDQIMEEVDGLFSGLQSAGAIGSVVA